jgi:hypothetical protein
MRRGLANSYDPALISKPHRFMDAEEVFNLVTNPDKNTALNKFNFLMGTLAEGEILNLEIKRNICNADN